MACSVKQTLSNIANSKKSTGPKTIAGKNRSRENSYKHGLTGKGIVLCTEDVEALDERFQEYDEELQPRSAIARGVVGNVALMAVRMDRCAVHEAKMTRYRQRRAVEDFDDARLAEVEKLFKWIAAEPATNSRRLKRSPEGLDTMIAALRGLGNDLLNPRGPVWNYQRCDLLHNIMGRQSYDLPTTRAYALTEVVMKNDPKLLNQDPGELPPEGISRDDRTTWCYEHLIDLINAETTKLLDLKAKMDLTGLELDRAEAAERAIFDPSKEAELARKYEGAARRGFLRSLEEFRRLQSEIPAPLPDPAPPEFEPEPGSCLQEIPEEGGEAQPELGSCLQEPPEGGSEGEKPDPTDASTPPGVAGGVEIVAEGPPEVAPGAECIDDR